MRKIKAFLRKPLALAEVQSIILLGAILFVIAIMILFGSDDVYAKEKIEFNPKIDIKSTFNVFPQVTGHSLEQIMVFRQAWKISGDKKFIMMLKGESGSVTIDKKSLVPGEPSYGYCQIHAGYHPEIVNDPQFFTDRDWQLEQCFRLWEGHTKFYGVANIPKINKFFTFK